jgi:hypothetical protein
MENTPTTVDDLASVLQACVHEIENLQRKIAVKEEEGWEGSRRRMELKREASRLLDALRPECSLNLQAIFDSLTPVQQQLHKRRLELEESINKSQAEKYNIVSACGVNHVIIRGSIFHCYAKKRVIYTNEGKAVDDEKPEKAFCAVCGKDFGWYCPTSTTKYCQYEIRANDHNCLFCNLDWDRK